MTDIESLKEYFAQHGAPPLTEDQLLCCVAIKKLITEGDMPEEDWQRLYKNHPQGSFAAFKQKMRAKAPAFLYDLLNREGKA